MPLVDLVEQAYRFEPDDQAWLGDLMRAARPLMDAGFGVGAFTFDASDPSRFSWSEPLVESPIPTIGPALGGALASLSPKLVEEMFWAPATYVTVSQALGLGKAFRQHPLAVAIAHPFGIEDLLTFKVLDASRRGLLLAAALPNVTSASKRRAAAFERCAAHVAAAMRLRKKAAKDAVTEAVLDPDGKLHHAEGPATTRRSRAELSDAARAMDRARARRSALSDEEALQVWQALVAGRWSLVDQFESDGKRFVVARRNEPDTPDPRGLTLRQRQVVAYSCLGHSTSLIAYELGLSPSTVSEHLKCAMQKLGAKTRAELLGLVRAVLE